MQNPSSLSKGFALSSPSPQPSRKTHQYYFAELKRRYLTDESELLIGTVEILVPKSLTDPTRKASNREVWDCFAKAIAYHLLLTDESQSRQINQIFVFDNRFRLVHRVETNPWVEGDIRAETEEEVKDADWDLIELAAQRCQVEVKWLEVPQIA